VKKLIFESRFGTAKDLVLANFLTRYKCKMNLSKLPDELQIVLPYTVSTADKKLVFIKNSKAACTSITHLIYEYTHGTSFAGNTHHDNIDLRQGIIHWKDNLELLENSSATIFSIVRDPESRLVSAFKNFFIQRNNRSGKKHFNAIAGFGFCSSNSLEKNFDIFLEYVESAHQIDPYRVDRHWRAQHINLGIGIVEYSHIGKFEKLAEELEFISGLARINPEKLRIQKGGQRNATNMINLEISPKQSSLIRSLYAKDYELFGYE